VGAGWHRHDELSSFFSDHHQKDMANQGEAEHQLLMVGVFVQLVEFPYLSQQ